MAVAFRPEKLTDRLGKILCPTLLVLISVIFIGCLVCPWGITEIRGLSISQARLWQVSWKDIRPWIPLRPEFWNYHCYQYSGQGSGAGGCDRQGNHQGGNYSRHFAGLIYAALATSVRLRELRPAAWTMGQGYSPTLRETYLEMPV